MLLEVGRVTKPHGLRGEVFVKLTTNRTERLAAGSVLRTADGSELKVERSGPHQKGWIVAFAGVSGREGAEALRDTVLLAAPVEDRDALWVHELIGAQVVDAEGHPVGEVEAVEANPASDLLVLASGALVPLRFVTSFSDGRVVIDPPPGLLDLDT